MNEWIQLISSVGFPIFACCALGFYVWKMQEKTNDTLLELKLSIETMNTLVKVLIEKEDERNV